MIDERFSDFVMIKKVICFLTEAVILFCTFQQHYSEFEQFLLKSKHLFPSMVGMGIEICRSDVNNIAKPIGAQLVKLLKKICYLKYINLDVKYWLDSIHTGVIKQYPLITTSYMMLILGELVTVCKDYYMSIPYLSTIYCGICRTCERLRQIIPASAPEPTNGKCLFFNSCYYICYVRTIGCSK